MKTIFLSLLALMAALTAAGQTQTAVPSDEEDPYLLLCGQADKAVADGDYEGATHRLLEAIAIRPSEPQNVLLLSNLGMLYSYMDRDSMALSTLDEALRRAPGLRTAMSARARVLLKLRRDKEAYSAFEELIAADSLNTDARYYHGIMALYGGKRDIAEADFEVLKASDPTGYTTARAMGMLYSITGREKQAVPYLRRILSVEPEAEFYAALAGCLLALGELTEASATISEGLGKYPDDPELYYYRAMLNRDRFLLDDAHSDAKRAVALGLNPARASALFEK